MSNARFNISVSRLYTLTILFFYDSSKLFSKRAFFLLTSSRRVSFLSTTTSRQRSNTRTSSGIHPERIRNSLNNFKRRREPFSSNTINYSNRKTPPSPVVSPDDHHPSRLHTGLTCVRIRAQDTYNRRSTHEASSLRAKHTTTTTTTTTMLQRNNLVHTSEETFGYINAPNVCQYKKIIKNIEIQYITSLNVDQEIGEHRHRR